MRLKYLIIVAAGAALLTLDRWLKDTALSGVHVDSPFGQFVLFKNYGVIFSWPLPNMVASVLMLGAFVVVVWLLVQAYRRHDLSKIIAATLLLIGAVSNIYDRLNFGFIIDWAYLGQWWPVFNVADVCITVGLVMLVTKRLTR